MKKLSIYLLLGTTVIDIVMRTIYPTEGKTVPLHFPPVPFEMVHEARSVAEKGKSDACQEVESDLVLFVTPTLCDPKCITVAR